MKSLRLSSPPSESCGEAGLAPTHGSIMTEAEALSRKMGCPQDCDEVIWLESERHLRADGQCRWCMTIVADCCPFLLARYSQGLRLMVSQPKPTRSPRQQVRKHSRPRHQLELYGIEMASKHHVADMERVSRSDSYSEFLGSIPSDLRNCWPAYMQTRCNLAVIESIGAQFQNRALLQAQCVGPRHAPTRDLLPESVNSKSGQWGKDPMPDCRSPDICKR